MPAVLVVLFLVVPILEIWLILQVGQVIGGWQTVGLLIAESLLGGWLVKREGRRAWRALQASLRTAVLPGRELLDGALVLVGGTLLLTPGFLTDVVGFFLILPFTRPLARRALTSLLTRRVLAGSRRRARRAGTGQPVPPGFGWADLGGQPGATRTTGGTRAAGRPGAPAGPGRVLRGEVVSDDVPPQDGARG